MKPADAAQPAPRRSTGDRVPWSRRWYRVRLALVNWWEAWPPGTDLGLMHARQPYLTLSQVRLVLTTVANFGVDHPHADTTDVAACLRINFTGWFITGYEVAALDALNALNVEPPDTRRTP